MYDLYVVAADGVNVPSAVNVGWQGRSVSLSEAHELASAMRGMGLAALIRPARYAAGKVSLENAVKIASAELNRLISEGARLSRPWREAHDPAWWGFVVDNLDAQEAGWIPGLHCIAVDRADGHVLTRHEVAELSALSVLP